MFYLESCTENFISLLLFKNSSFDIIWEYFPKKVKSPNMKFDINIYW